MKSQLSLLFDIEMLRFWIGFCILISLPAFMIMSFRIKIFEINFGKISSQNNWNYLPYNRQHKNTIGNVSQIFDMVNHYGCHLMLFQIENKTDAWHTRFWVLHRSCECHVCVHDVWQTECLHFINQLVESIRSFTIIDIRANIEHWHGWLRVLCVSQHRIGNQ